MTAVSMEGLSLDDNIQLNGVEKIALVDLNISKTILGRTIIEHAPAPAGHPLELVASENGGRFLKSEIDAMMVMRDTVQKVTLVHHRGSFRVIILSIDVRPDFDIVNPDNDWWFTGTINLLTV